MKMRKILPVSALLLLSACIPRGAGDYSVASTDKPPPPTQASPQIVPEHTIIADTPSWSPAIVERNARQVDESVYVVQPGDTLYKIEAQTGAGLRQIVEANNLAMPYTLQVSQRLTIPGGLYHRVARGETGIAIARAYGASWADIVSLNAILPPYILREGQRLRLPVSASAVPVTVDITPEQRAASFSLNIDDVVTGGEPALAQAGAQPASVALVDRPTHFAGTFIWPVEGSLLRRFGVMGGGRTNDGINIGAALGTAVHAASDGVVVYSGNEIGVFGGLVLVDHGGGWITAYGHLGQLDVARADKVFAGQKIGAVGDTGYVTQPQLHFEIRKDRKPLDPLTKLAAR
jgi:murein DD-endopeptidase MepM/ murein hydrolase activator NlpD